MRVAIVGTGYVGLVTGACLAQAGNQVSCIDNNASKIARITAGQLPFHEPQLDELVDEGRATGHLRFTSDLVDGISDASVVFLAIGTPSAADGCADTSALLACATQLAEVINHDCLVVIKSTAPVGTCEVLQDIFSSAVSARAATCHIEVASNPEFLAEGSAVRDFRDPARIVIGTGSAHAQILLRELYAPFDPDGSRVLCMALRSAEFAKYACNAMLAARISMINELADIAAQMGADMDPVCKVLRTDPRIGGRYLQPGAGYGGSCLPKDLRALIQMAQDRQEPAALLRSVEQVNQRQVRLLFEAVRRHFEGGLARRTIAVWGLSFKPGTDDIREAPSLILIRLLLDAGARVRAYDPVARDPVRRTIADTALALVESAQDACKGSDALVVMTEWDEFRSPDFAQLADCLESAAIFDGRNLYRHDRLASFGLRHYRIGQPDTPQQKAALRDRTLLPMLLDPTSVQDFAATQPNGG